MEFFSVNLIFVPLNKPASNWLWMIYNGIWSSPRNEILFHLIYISDLKRIKL